MYEEVNVSPRIEVTKSERNMTTEHLRNNYREFAKSAHLGTV